MHDEDGSKRQRAVHVVMAGGGTGGHVYPALAVAAELVDRGDTVSWIGRAASMEETLVRSAGLRFEALDARPWVGKGPAAKAAAAVTLLTSAFRARGLLRRLGAGAVLGTGGYVSTPALLGARLAKQPAFLLEPNAVAGTANRVASRWCRAAFVAHEETARRLACEVVVTGIPVRRSFEEIGALPEGDAQLLVLGGSQGALQINEMMPSAVRRLRRAAGGARFKVVHQTGRAHRAAVEDAYARAGLSGDPGLEVVPYIDDMAAAMARAHLVISRAGALTIAELCAAGRPAILIPLLGAGAGHQRFNASKMMTAGAAILLADEEATSANLSQAIAGIIDDRARLESMAAAARSAASPAAAAEIADALERSGGGS